MRTILLPFKVKDTENLSWSKGLTSFLKRAYGSSQWSVFYDADKTKELDACRMGSNSDLAPESLLEQNYRYSAILEQIYLRLGAQTGTLQMDFVWYEAEYTSGLSGKKYKQHTVVFEKSAVMYNIGVLLTHVAAKKMVDDYKNGIPYLTKAMSCFEYMSKNFLNSPSQDLTSETTTFLTDICHAEAQELFLLTLVNESESSKKASLISRIARSTASFYEACGSYYENDSGDTLDSVPYGEEKWKSIVKLKAHLYKAISAFNHALVLEQSSKIGMSIAFTKIALSEIKDSLIYKVYVKEEMDLESLKAIIDSKLKSLLKDNDFIYNDVIPTDAKFDSIKAMDAIKPIKWESQLSPYNDQVADLCNSVFKGIIPMVVFENESIYTEKKASLLRAEVDNSDTADWEYQSFIEFTDLPKLITGLEAKYKDGGKTALEDPQCSFMKQQLSSWSNTIHNSKFKNIEYQMDNIISKRNEILSILQSVSPEQKDNTLKIKSSLVQASQSDEKIFANIKPFLEEIKLLDNFPLLWEQFNRFQLQTTEPSLLDMDDGKNEEILSRIKKIKENQETLKLLKEERSRNLKDFKENVSNDDITQKLILHRGKTHDELEEIFEQELDKFKPISTRIEATVFKQSSLINDTKIKLDEIFKMTGIQDKTPEQELRMRNRQEFFEKLEKATAAFVAFDADLPKGLNFYDTLIKMTRELSVASQSNTGISQFSPNHTTSELSHRETSEPLQSTFAKLSVNVTDQMSPASNSSAPTPPPRTYIGGGGIQDKVVLSNSDAPPVPPKPLASGMSSLLGEPSPNGNPTSFYNNPSVFDENLYSKFSR